MWQTFESDEHKAVLLIDEIDKADINFPNDLLLLGGCWIKWNFITMSYNKQSKQKLDL